MVSHTAIEETDIQPQLVKGVIVGGVLGAAVGVAAAYMLMRGMERNRGELRISAGEGLRLSLIVMALLRQIADLPENKK